VTDQQNSFVLPLAGYYAWAPTLQNSEAWFEYLSAAVFADELSNDLPMSDVKFIDVMTRRRLSSYARMGLSALHQLVADQALPVVFASRHGDVNKTINLMTILSQQETLSPTAFGLSVHNAVGGLWAIIKKNQAVNVALAAGTESLSQALIEVFARMASSPNQPYVLLYVDEAVPALYRDYLPDLQFPHVCALLFDPKSTQQLTINWMPNASGLVDAMPQSFALLNVLFGVGASSCWSSQDATWDFALQS
jgi:Beta-ketoacyl synthase, N-terminal domain